MQAKEILHSHNPKDIHLGNDHTVYILSTRNLIESTFSRIIVNYTKRVNFLKYTSITPTPFKANVDDFKQFYDSSYNFYLQVKEILPKNVLRIDYSQFCDDVKNLCSILSMPKNWCQKPQKIRIVKTPGSHRDWIENYDELLNYARTFDCNPPI